MRWTACGVSLFSPLMLRSPDKQLRECPLWVGSRRSLQAAFDPKLPLAQGSNRPGTVGHCGRQLQAENGPLEARERRGAYLRA